MSAYELKTKMNEASVPAFLNSIENSEQRADAKALNELMKKITGSKPKMWGKSIVGYGSYHYKSASGQEGDWMATGFSPRKANLTVYVMPGYMDLKEELKELGPHSLGKSCLYIKRLSDIHIPTLKKIVKHGLRELKKKYSVKT